MSGIRLSERVLIVGQTGKGKTTLARFLVAGLQPVRVIVFDPKGELHFDGPDGQLVEPCYTPDELAARMPEPLIHFIPASFKRDDLEEACAIVKDTPGPYVWWIDEAAELSSPGYCPEGLRLAVTQGREPRKMVIALTQRLAEVHPVFRSQCEHIFLFVPPPIELDLKTIAGTMHRDAAVLKGELERLQADQGLYSHLWFQRDGNELLRCAPIPAEATPGVPGRPATAAAGDVQGSGPCEPDSSSEASSESG